MKQESFPVVIITGISGSGKSTALDVFEDMGFYRIDGLPSSLIPSLLVELDSPPFADFSGLVLGVDLRQKESVDAFEESLKELRKAGVGASIIFFEARPESIVKRYASTRRPHPLEKEGLGLEQALDAEKSRLESIRQIADLVVDTSNYSIHDLRRTLQKKWDALSSRLAPRLRVHFISFGFKYGTPSEADYVFDLRFLPNPYFIDELRPLSGQDKAVADYVLNSEQGKVFYQQLLDFIKAVLTHNENEGRYRVTIGIGCTGGRHRSVANAEALSKELSNEQYTISLEHRHLNLG